MADEKITDIDALGFAIKLEKMARKFYLALAKKTRKKSLKPVFKDLAAFELAHLRNFEQMRVELDEDKYWFGSYDDPEVVSYFQALSLTNLFGGGKQALEKVLKKCNSAVDAIMFAIAIEKDSILLYSHLWEHSIDKNVKEMFSRLIDEEKKHLQILVGKLVDIA